MKKWLFLSVLLIASCISLRDLWTTRYEYCGKVDVLEVYKGTYSFLSCKDALAVTDAAYEILWQKVGTLNQPWRVEFMSGSISVDDPYAFTDPVQRLIRIKEEQPRSILHELRHAYMYETHTGGKTQHGTMCGDEAWLKLEREFEVLPYCHLVR